MMKIMSVIKQNLDAEGNVVGKARLMAYFPRTKDEIVSMIAAKGISLSDETVISKDKAWSYTMTKQDDTKFKITLIYTEFEDIEVFTEHLKKIKGAVQKQSEKIIGAKVEFDTVNWINEVYF